MVGFHQLTGQHLTIKQATLAQSQASPQAQGFQVAQLQRQAQLHWQTPQSPLVHILMQALPLMRKVD
jgi:hypothetical protein